MADYAGFLACLGALPIALSIAWVVEEVLKRSWHSGREVVLEETAVSLNLPHKPTIRLTWGDSLTQLNWFFRLQGYPRGGRERRVPEKWVCLASELRQDNQRIIVHTYVAPGQAKTWLDNKEVRPTFHEIHPIEVYTKSWRERLAPPERPSEIPAKVLSGGDGRYWLAEKRRWELSVELTPADFQTLMQVIQQKNGGV